MTVHQFRKPLSIDLTIRCLLAAAFLTVPAGCGNDVNDRGRDTVGIGDSADDLPVEDSGHDDASIPGDTATEIDSRDADPIAPVYWSADATVTMDSPNFVTVEGKPFFAIGFDTSGGPVYDGVSGPNQCNRATMTGYVDLNVEKNQMASEAGANFAYVWGYDGKQDSLVAVNPRFHGIFHSEYQSAPLPESDVIPIIYNAFGEEDMEDRTESNANRMHNEFMAFRDRTGRYSPELMPNLPPFVQIPWFSWHPTSRMRGGGTETTENLTDERATTFARTTNMMIGDYYTYVTNRFDRSTEQGAWDAVIYRQIGDVDEGYDDWLASDDPDHRDHFSSGWDLARSLVTRRNPDSVVWMWLQGYSFSYGIDRSLCEKGSSEAGRKGGFPPDRYIRKDITSVIAAGATGFIFFGYHMTLMPETETMLKHFRALSLPEIYEGALTAPELVLETETTFLGEPGHDGKGRAHATVRWHEQSKTAYVIASNPGPYATTIDIAFPWDLSSAEQYDWYGRSFAASPSLSVSGRNLTCTIPVDDGVILKVRPLHKAGNSSS